MTSDWLVGHQSSGTITNSIRTLRGRSKGGNTLKNVDVGEQRANTEELAMEECDAGTKKQQVLY